MKEKELVDSINLKRSRFNDITQAINMANMCNTISRDINTDSQRFIYELLQNADDASNQTGELNVSIEFVDNFIIFSHKGLAFSEIDIDSISSAGDGTKSTDSSKTGFKGIGFKSVFSQSDLVFIKSGSFCFKFDKNSWSDYWNSEWGNKEKWQLDRRSIQKDDSVRMPWQIIPIWSDVPSSIQALRSLSDYNVSTIISYPKIESIKSDLEGLFSDSQIVLFLRSKRVKISIFSSETIVIEKNTIDGVTTLTRNGVKISEWLVKTSVFNIGKEVSEAIDADEKSPKKLKEATSTELSFAIQLLDGNLSRVEKNNRLIFTYLPTSVNYDLPFLVNGNFLTDAGRQQLHQDVVWNNWLFKEIPMRYFAWIAELAENKSLFNNDILKVLPNKLYGFKLGSSFNEGLNKALDTIAFLPNLEGNLVKISDAIFDESNLSNVLDSDMIVGFINDVRNSKFTKDSFIKHLEPIKELKNLGVYNLDIDQIDAFIHSSPFREQFKIEDNFGLIEFFYDRFKEIDDDYEQHSFIQKLKEIPFIFSEKGELVSPEKICFPSKEYSDEFSNENKTMHSEVYKSIDNKSWCKNWVRDTLGVKNPSVLSFIEKTILSNNSNFVTLQNTIEIGRYIYRAHLSGLLKDEHYSKLQHLKLLSNKGSLLNASDMYLAEVYGPTFNLEPHFDSDLYISESYLDKNDNYREWGSFFIKIGVKEDIGVIDEKINYWEKQWIDRFDSKFLDQLFKTSKRVYNNSGQGWTYDTGQYQFTPLEVQVKNISFIGLAQNYDFSRLLFKRVFQKVNPQDIQFDKELYVNGAFGFYNGSIGPNTFERFNVPYVYFKWLLDNFKIFPTINKECQLASDIILNTEENKILGKGILPVLDYEDALSPEWKEVLKFKENIDLNDYLYILEKISNNHESDKSVDNDDLHKINLVYQKMSAMQLHESEQNQIRDWAKKHKLLSINKKDFCYANELSVVTIDGFKADRILYCDEKSKIDNIELFKLFGIKIIENVVFEYGGKKELKEAFKAKLKDISPLITLVSEDNLVTNDSFEKSLEEIQNRFDRLNFYVVESISLSYGNEQDKLNKSTWVDQDNFYYVGDWYSPRILDGLVDPLSKFLGIKKRSRVLNILLLETFQGGVSYLEENGFNTTLICQKHYPKFYENVNEVEINNRSYNEIDENIGWKGEQFVYERLKQLYARKYSEDLLESDLGFKIGDYVEVIWKNKIRPTFSNHDLLIHENNKKIYIESKATTYNKGVEKVPLFISDHELNLMKEVDDYVLARVYNVRNTASVEFIKMEKFGEL